MSGIFRQYIDPPKCDAHWCEHAAYVEFSTGASIDLFVGRYCVRDVDTFEQQWEQGRDGLRPFIRDLYAPS